MELALRQRIIAMGAVALALLGGWQIAHGAFGLVAVIAAAAVLLGITTLFTLGADVLAAGAVLLGYLIGNRGFAQLHPPNLPLLPAEAALGLGLACGLWRWARARELPVRIDALNLALVLWVALAAVRVPIDVRTYGAMALRDFAMVYYALFFFLAQAWASDERSRRMLTRCLTFGLALVVPVFLVFNWWPEWFLSVLTVAGAPLIFVKSDVAGGFMAGGALWFAHRFALTRHTGWLGLSVLSVAGVALSNSRAAVVALGVGMLWLLGVRRWRTLGTLAAILLAGLMLLGIHAATTRQPFTATPLYRVYESVASVLDPAGVRRYQAADLQDKPDNNQFRLVWWRELAAETWSNGRWFGLGFGRDLALEFLRVYYADANDDFSARSPHNFLLTVFARTGLIGSVAFLVVLIAMIARTAAAGQRHGLRREGSSLGLWLIAWAILASACFGVVLEGPMGAVVFWIILGLANGAPHAAGIAVEPADAESSEELAETPPTPELVAKGYDASASTPSRV